MESLFFQPLSKKPSITTPVPLFTSDRNFIHELSGNYKPCGAQLKAEDVRVSEQTSTAVCQRASGG